MTLRNCYTKEENHFSFGKLSINKELCDRRIHYMRLFFNRNSLDLGQVRPSRKLIKMNAIIL